MFRLLHLVQPACATRDAAALRAFADIVEAPGNRTREFAGELVASSGGFRYTGPRAGGPASANVYPSRRNYEGAYHSHADLPGYDRERFSPADKNLADRTGKPIYLLTPSGSGLRYDPDPKRAGGGNESIILPKTP